jgi:hypothetical protein
MIEDLYAESFVGGKPDGRPPISARIAFGAIFIKEQENLTDRQTVGYTLENPYAQFFLGLSAFRQEPLFDDSMMARFCYRFTPEKMMKINEELYRRTNLPKPPNDGGNDGTLILDAYAAPADVCYPTDLSLLNKEQTGFIKKNLEVLDGLAREAWGAIGLKRMEWLHTIREVLEQQTSILGFSADPN